MFRSKCYNNGINYIQENVIYSSDVRGVTIKQDIIFDEIGLPYKFSAFIREVSGKKIEKEEFEQQKQEVIKRIS